MSETIGLSELAAETNLTAEQREYVDSACRSAESLLKVIDDIIDFSRIEAGTLVLEQDDFNLFETLYEVMQRYSPFARQQGLELLLDIDNDVPATVFGDATRFRQVIENLIDNALSFTDWGEIRVTASSVFRSEQVTGLHFRVVNTGTGLVQHQFERAIEPFAAPSDFDLAAVRSSGLGLAVSNRLIEMMGGTLWLEDRITLGSILHFTTTFGTTDGEVSIPPDLRELGGTSVLIVAADPVMRAMLQQLLSSWRMKATSAVSGRQAIEIIQTANANGAAFDIALIDRHMPGTNGFLLAEQIREHTKLQGTVIKVLSPVDTVSITNLTREVLPPGSAVTPASYAALLKAVAGAMRTTQARTARGLAAPQVRPPTHAGKRILKGHNHDGSLCINAYKRNTIPK